MKRSLFLILFLGTTSATFAQQVVFNREYFFGRQPSAKAEALGRTAVADDGPAASMLWANVAGLGFTTNASLYGSYATPYYLATDMRYAYGAATARINTRWSVGIGYHHMDFGATHEAWNESTSTYTVAAGFRIGRRLSAGLALDVMDVRRFEFDGKLAPMINPGLQYRSLHRVIGKRISMTKRFGISVANANVARLHGGFGYTGADLNAKLPVTVRAGGAYVITLRADSGKTIAPVVATLSAEYEGPINFDYDQSIKGGFEVLVYDLIALRCGYYTTNVYDYGYPQYNKNRVSDFTYGAGLKIAGRRICSALRRYTLTLDYCSLPQVSYSKMPPWNPALTKPFQSFDFGLTYKVYSNRHSTYTSSGVSF